MKLHFYGCRFSVNNGRFLWGTERPTSSIELSFLPEGIVDKIDGGFCSNETKENFKAVLHYVHLWTVIAFWDRTLDHKEDGNSVLLAEGVHSPESIIEECEKHFLDVYGRLWIDFEVVETVNSDSIPPPLP